MLYFFVSEKKLYKRNGAYISTYRYFDPFRTKAVKMNALNF